MKCPFQPSSISSYFYPKKEHIKKDQPKTDEKPRARNLTVQGAGLGLASLYYKRGGQSESRVL